MMATNQQILWYLFERDCMLHMKEIKAQDFEILGSICVIFVTGCI